MHISLLFFLLLTQTLSKINVTKVTCARAKNTYFLGIADFGQVKSNDKTATNGDCKRVFHVFCFFCFCHLRTDRISWACAQVET